MVEGIGYKRDAGAVVVLLHFPGTVAAALAQVVGELHIAVLVDQALLHDIGGWIGQRLQEVGGILVGLDDDRLRVGRQDAVVDDGLDLASVELVGVQNERFIGRGDR